MINLAPLGILRMKSQYSQPTHVLHTWLGSSWNRNEINFTEDTDFRIGSSDLTKRDTFRMKRAYHFRTEIFYPD